MRANITFNEISNELYNIFSDDRTAAAYMADGLGPQYIGLCGWAGAMSPANRAAFVATFGREMTDRAEDQARARVANYRAAVESSTYHAAELEADAWQAVYGDPEKSQAPEVGAFVWGRWSCLKGEDGPLGELEDLERMEADGDEIRRRLCEVVAVVDASPAEFMNREFADGVARQFKELGGSRYEESDPLRLDGHPMSWELVFCVRCAGRWYLIDGQGYDYTRYFLMPEEYRRMYAAELATITAAREQREADERAEAQRQADARRADYLARCARWAPLMEDVRPLIDAERAAYDTREKSQIRKSSAKLSAARRRNLVAMASALYPGVKFSAKKWDGWGGSYELTWTDGPTVDHLEKAGDFRLFERSRDVFNGYDDSSDVIRAEFVEFADKYFDLGGQIRFSREVSDEFRQSIADRIREAVPGLSASEVKPITDDGQQSAICGMFREVEGVELSPLCNHLEKGLFFAVSYLCRCMDATPARQDDPTDPDTPNGDGEPSRPRYRHRYLPGTEPAAPALPEPPAAVVYDPAQPIESAPFHAVDAEGLAYGDAEKSQNPETMRAEAQREEVCDWYCYEYPTDEEGQKIRAGITFADIMAHPERIYNYIPGDSLIRERVFRETANRYGVEYSEVYDRWLDGTPSDSPKGESCDADGAAYGEPEKSPVPAPLSDIYQRAKAKCAEAVALFHCGDWFTAYGEDADRVADAVGIIITTTRDGFRQVSFPSTALDTYLTRMVRQGIKVCICEVPRQSAPSRLEKVAQEA